MSHNRWVSLLALAPLAAGLSVQAADTVDVNDGIRAKYNFVVNGFAASRQELRTGQFRFQGIAESPAEEEREEGGPENPEQPIRWRQVGEISGFCAFDYPNEKFRFDRIDPDALEHGGQYARTPESVTQRRTSAPEILISNAATKTPKWLSQFDVRALGAGYVLGMDRTTLPEVVKNLEKDASLLSELTEDDGLTRVKWISKNSNGDPTHECIIWFRESNNFLPDRLEVSKVLSTAFSAEGELLGYNWSSVQQSVKVVGEQFQGHWVPKSVVITLRSKATWRNTLTFTWEKLNEPIDESKFHWEGFDATGADAVMDNRLGKLVTLKKFGPKDDTQLAAKSASKNTPNKQTNGVSRWRIVVVNLVVLSIIGIALFRKSANDSGSKASGQR